jgi:hypothetical protein
VRVDCSLCGVKMLDLDLCLSASVHVRSILHTQPLGIYNKDLVWKSIHLSLSLSILVGLPFSPSIAFDIVACYLSPPPGFLFLSHLPLLFRLQKTESATPMTIATTTPGSHHVLSSCWPCLLSFRRPWCNDNMSIE